MKRRWSFRLALVMLFAMLMQMTVCAAGNATVTINSCTIAGNTVTVVATGAVPASDDGVYYLFELKPYQTEVGARADFCASAPQLRQLFLQLPWIITVQETSCIPDLL